jgi:sortase (surface protein transpeptidase)
MNPRAGRPLSRALLCGATVTGVAAVVVAAREPVPVPPPPAPAVSPARVEALVTAPKAHPRPLVVRHREPLPVRLQVPAIGIDAPLVRLGLDERGALEVPQRPEQAGWFGRDARPGERGAAVIAGHVDSAVGPAVFYRLGALHRGDAIRVRRRDGSTVAFRVQRVERWPKARFPTARVYGATRRPSLRLVTCGGAFDAGSGHYVDNTIVFAARG